jgi:hypothetical protein
MAYQEKGGHDKTRVTEEGNSISEEMKKYMSHSVCGSPEQHAKSILQCKRLLWQDRAE